MSEGAQGTGAWVPRATKRLQRSFLGRDPVVVAPELLGKLLQRGPLLARIVEVEAYRGVDDDASHAFRGKTPRNATMYGPPGHLYVYFTYGLHYCANVVCGAEGEAGAVLLRALAPLSGLEMMAERRSKARKPLLRRDDSRPAARQTAMRELRVQDLCSGPAKLCQAFGLDRRSDGYDLIRGNEGLLLLDDGTQAPNKPSVGTRIGLARGCVARDRPWRWWVPGEPSVSGRRGSR